MPQHTPQTFAYKLTPGESEAIANFVAAEMNWKLKWGYKAHSLHSIIKDIKWNQACIDVDIYYNCSGKVEDLDTLRIWLDKEAELLGFCYNLQVIN